MRVYDAGSEISPPQAGLVAHWSMDTHTIAGDTIIDQSDSGYDGTLNGNPTVTDGQIDEALDFTPIDDTAIGDSAVSISSAFSISQWVRVDSESQMWKCISSNSTGGSQGGFTGFRVLLDGTSDFRVDLSNSTTGNSFRSNFHTPTVGEWYHIVATYDGSTPRFYVDNTLIDDGEFSDDINSGALSVGAYNNSTSNADISVDDVRLYTRALTENEIDKLYQYDSEWNRTSFTKYDGQSQTYRGMPEYQRDETASQWTDAYLPEGLVGYWSFDDFTTDDTTVTDCSPNDNDGTINGNPAQTTGKIEQSFSFNGETDQITVPLSASLSPDYISVFAWVQSTYDSWQVIVSTDTYSMQQRKPGTFRADVKTGGTNYNTGSGPYINDGQWHHVGFTYDGETLMPYTDGESHDIDSSMSGPIDTPTNDMYIPYNADLDEGKTLYSGKIDDVRIYDRALTESEVHALYQQGATE